MRIGTFALLLTSALASATALADVRLEAGKGRTPDGRFDTQCAEWEASPRNELCFVSIYRVLAQPERYHGKMIRIVGFLIYEDGVFVIYPDRQRFDAGSDLDSFQLLDVKEIPKALLDDAKRKGTNVGIIAEFDARYFGPQMNRTGGLRNTFNAWPSRRIPVDENTP